MKQGFNTIYCHWYWHNEQNGVQDAVAIHPLFVHCANTLWTEIVLRRQLTSFVLDPVDLGTKGAFGKYMQDSLCNLPS